MIRGLYTAGAGLWANRFLADVLTNNLANINTPGFREARPVLASFPETLIQVQLTGVAAPGPAPAAGLMGTGVAAVAAVPDFTAGPLRDTGVSTDLAVEGEGFFAVQTPQGVEYTRRGTFGVDANGRLVTAEGYLVLGEHGPIVVGDATFDVAPDGTITRDGNVIDRLLVADPGDGATLQQVDGAMFRSTAPLGPLAGARVRQGAVEGSNVDETAGLVDLLTAMRAYEASARAVQAENDTLQKAVNDVGRV